mmetsp:Transcript_43814/g.137625  ORF Transcript_43814/g.137625 Transcript_43814/m.137625 type:complete len:270 (+) Transcript_43814:390-1199(+)
MQRSVPTHPNARRPLTPSQDDAGVAAAGAAARGAVPLEPEELLGVDGAAALLADHGHGLHGVHARELDERDGNEHRRAAEPRDAVHAEAGRRPVACGGGGRLRAEAVFDDVEPLLDDVIRRVRAVGVLHLVHADAGRLDLRGRVRLLAHAHEVRHVLLLALEQVLRQVLLLRRVEDEEAVPVALDQARPPGQRDAVQLHLACIHEPALRRGAAVLARPPWCSSAETPSKTPTGRPATTHTTQPPAPPRPSGRGGTVGTSTFPPALGTPR